MPLAFSSIKRRISIEIAWLLGSWAFSWLLLCSLLGYNYLWSAPLEIQMHNTYFVVQGWVATALMFLLTATLVTSIRVLLGAFRQTAPNTVLAVLTGIWSLAVLFVLIIRSLKS